MVAPIVRPITVCITVVLGGGSLPKPRRSLLDALLLYEVRLAYADMLCPFTYRALWQCVKFDYGLGMLLELAVGVDVERIPRLRSWERHREGGAGGSQDGQ